MSPGVRNMKGTGCWRFVKKSVAEGGRVWSMIRSVLRVVEGPGHELSGVCQPSGSSLGSRVRGKLGGVAGASETRPESKGNGVRARACKARLERVFAAERRRGRVVHLCRPMPPRVCVMWSREYVPGDEWEEALECARGCGCGPAGDRQAQSRGR